MEQSHIMNLVVLEDVGAGTPTTADSAYLDGLADVVDGEWRVCNDQNLILTAATVLTDDRAVITGFKIVGRNDGNLISTDLIRLADIINIRATDVAASAEQVTHIGYTGSAGAIQVINDNIYKVKVQFWEEGRTGQGMNDFVSIFYESDSAATGTEVAYSIEELLRLSFNKQAERPVYLRVLNSAALDTNLDLTGAVTVVNGSRFVTVAAALTTDGGVEVVEVGDSLRLGDASETDAAVALGSSVYKVVAINTLTLTLDRPVTGVSGSYTASTDVQLIKAATANAANFGLELHGIARTHVVGKRPYSKVSFTIGIENFGTTTTTYTTAMSLGHGDYRAIRDLEWFCHGNTGDRYRGDYMYQGYTTNVAASTNGFVQLSILYNNNSRSEGINGPGHNPKQLIIAADDAFANTESPDLVIEVIDGVMGAMGLTASGLAK